MSVLSHVGYLSLHLVRFYRQETRVLTSETEEGEEEQEIKDIIQADKDDAKQEEDIMGVFDDLDDLPLHTSASVSRLNQPMISPEDFPSAASFGGSGGESLTSLSTVALPDAIDFANQNFVKFASILFNRTLIDEKRKEAVKTLTLEFVEVLASYPEDIQTSVQGIITTESTLVSAWKALLGVIRTSSREIKTMRVYTTNWKKRDEIKVIQNNVPFAQWTIYMQQWMALLFQHRHPAPVKEKAFPPALRIRLEYMRKLPTLTSRVLQNYIREQLIFYNDDHNPLDDDPLDVEETIHFLNNWSLPLSVTESPVNKIRFALDSAYKTWRLRLKAQQQAQQQAQQLSFILGELFAMLQAFLEQKSFELEQEVSTEVHGWDKATNTYNSFVWSEPFTQQRLVNADSLVQLLMQYYSFTSPEREYKSSSSSSSSSSSTYTPVEPVASTAITTTTTTAPSQRTTQSVAPSVAASGLPVDRSSIKEFSSPQSSDKTKRTIDDNSGDIFKAILQLQAEEETKKDLFTGKEIKNKVANMVGKNNRKTTQTNLLRIMKDENKVMLFKSRDNKKLQIYVQMVDNQTPEGKPKKWKLITFRVYPVPKEEEEEEGEGEGDDIV